MCLRICLLGDVDTLLIWKFLTRASSKPDSLTSAEFSLVYQAISFKWSLLTGKEGVTCWYRGSNKVLVKTVTLVSWFVSSKGFEFAVYGLVGLNTALLVLQAGLIQTTDQDHIVYNTEVGLVFMLLYVAEVVLKLLGMGLRGYLSCPWNIFDLLVTTTSLISLVLVFSSYDVEEHMSTIVVLRLVRVLRLFRMKNRVASVLFLPYHWTRTNFFLLN